MDVVRDVLDKKAIDRNGREIGRVDRILLRLRPGEPPAVEAIEIGPAALADRIHPVAGRWAVVLLQGCAVDPQPLCVDWKAVEVNDHVRVDITFGETPAASVEERLRRLMRRVVRWS